MGGRSFTEAEQEQLALLLSQGHSIRRIAREMGRGQSTIVKYKGDPFSEGRSCSDCESPISNDGKTGRCRGCNTARNNKRPDLAAKRGAGMREAMKDPLKYDRMCCLARNNIRKAMLNPETRARFVEVGKQRAAIYFNDPEIRAKINDPELRKLVGRKITEFRIGWCPPEYRDLYFEITRKTETPAAEAKKIILDQIKADEAKLSPFERQDRALARGARLIANDRAPMFGEALRGSA